MNYPGETAKEPFEVVKETKESVGLFHGYKPNRLSIYLILLQSGRHDECYDVIYKDMAKYKIED